MNKDLKDAKKLLLEEQFTCVLKKGDTIYTSKDRGVKPLLQWLRSGVNLEGFSVADKVVGKAAAYLYVLMKIDVLYARIISEHAMSVFKKYGVTVFYEEKVEAIRNRTNTGFCPMETAVMNINEPKAALEAIEEKLNIITT